MASVLFLSISICLMLLCLSETRFDSSQNPGQKKSTPLPAPILQWTLRGATPSYAATCSTRGEAMGRFLSFFGPAGQRGPTSWLQVDDIHPWWLFTFSGVSWSCQNQKVLQTEIQRARGMHIKKHERCVLKDVHLKETTKVTTEAIPDL